MSGLMDIYTKQISRDANKIEESMYPNLEKDEGEFRNILQKHGYVKGLHGFEMIHPKEGHLVTIFDNKDGKIFVSHKFNKEPHYTVKFHDPASLNNYLHHHISKE
jgi:hypothetical protein